MNMKDPKIQKIEALISPALDDMGFNLVRIRLGGNKNLTLQIMAECKDGAQITVGQCADISRAVSALLDVEDPITDAYNLEVSSPGIDRPLTAPEHFNRYEGFVAKIKTHDMLDGRKRFQGKLIGMENNSIRIHIDGEDYAIPYEQVDTAKLVLTDDLIDAAQAGQVSH